MSRIFLLGALLGVCAGVAGSAALGQPPAKDEKEGKGRKKPTLPVREIRLPQGRPFEFVFSPDGTRVAVGAGAVISVWNVADAAEVVRMHLPKAQSWLHIAFGLDGKTLVCHGREDPMVRFFDVKTGRQVREFPQPDPYKKEREQARAEAERRGKLDEKGFKPDKGESYAFSTQFQCYSPDGTRAVYASRVKGVDVVELATGKLVTNVPEERRWRACLFTPDGKSLVFFSTEAGIRFCDAQTGKLVKVLQDDPRFKGSGADTVVLSPDGNFLAAWGGPCTALDIWDVRAGKRVCTVQHHTYCYTARFSRDNQSLLILNNRSEIVLHHIVAEKTVHQFYPPETLANGIAFTPDEKKVVILAPTDDRGAVYQYSLFIHDLPPRLLDPAAARFDDAAPAKLWPKLLSDNELRLDLARKALRGAPKEAVALFRKELPPVTQARQKEVEQLLAELDDDDYMKRDRAMTTLHEVAHAFAPLLESRHKAAGPGEVRNRLIFVLAQMNNEKLPQSLVRDLRAVTLLEQIATPEARDLLTEIAQGAAEARLTHEARAALARLNKAKAAMK